MHSHPNKRLFSKPDGIDGVVLVLTDLDPTPSISRRKITPVSARLVPFDPVSQTPHCFQ